MYALQGSPEQIAQALRLAKKAELQDCRDWYFLCLLVCTAVVGFGLLLEAFEIAHDMWGIFRRKSIELKYWLTPRMYRKKYRVPDWMKVLTAVGWLLIVVGVIGEGVFEAYVSKYDGLLATFNDTLIADTQRDANNALAEAERLRAENLKLEATIAPRRLDAEQQKKIADNCGRLKNLSTGKRIKVVSYTLDSEGLVFAEQIVNVLRASGLTVDDDAMSVTPSQTIIFGIDVFGSDSELAKAVATAIGSSGKPIAVSFTVTDPTTGSVRFEYPHPPDQATILVGLKPPDADTIKELKRMMMQRNKTKP
jgi:hypothetical protein